MKKNNEGIIVIELVHDGIPDDELRPERFTEQQEVVLNALPENRQEPIRKGCPIIVVDKETGGTVAKFNLQNVKPDKYQMESLARSILEMMRKDYAEKGFKI